MKYPWLKFYEPGVPHQIDIPDWVLPQLLDRSVKTPEKTAIIYFGKEISYIHLYNLVNRFTAGLQNCGIQKGDRVILALPNIPQLIVAYWAVLRIGAIAVLVNPLLSGSELAHQIHACGAKTAIFWDRNLKKYKADSIKDLELIIAAGVESYMPFFMNMAFQIKKAFEEIKQQSRLTQKVLLFRELLGDHSPDVHAPLPLPDDPAVILFTGGVTGTPKPAVLSHRNLIANMLQAKSWITDFRDDGEVIVGALPLIHSYGMTACNHLAVGTRSTLLLYPRFHIKHIVDDIIKFKSGVFPGVPTMYSAILDEVKRRELSSLPIRICISGGAPLPVQLQNDFEKSTGAHLVEGFGLTEASPVTHCNPVRGINKKKSIGIPWPNTKARIVDRKTGTELGANKIGELQVKGPQIMQSYWQQGTGEEVIDAEGWLRTGDFAYKDTDGYFYIADRIKDVIFYGGESIYPSEIENLLYQYPNVKEVAVIGVTDNYYGQVIKALIVKDGTKTVTEKEIIQYCEEHLAKFKVPRYVEFVDKLPRNYLGKVLKRQLS